RSAVPYRSEIHISATPRRLRRKQWRSARHGASHAETRPGKGGRLQLSADRHDSLPPLSRCAILGAGIWIERRSRTVQVDLCLLAVSARREGEELSGGALHQRRFGHARRAAACAQDDRDDAGEYRLEQSGAAALSRFERSLRRRAAQGSGEQSGRDAVVPDVAIALT